MRRKNIDDTKRLLRGSRRLCALPLSAAVTASATVTPATGLGGRLLSLALALGLL